MRQAQYMAYGNLESLMMKQQNRSCKIIEKIPYFGAITVNSNENSQCYGQDTNYN